MEVSVFRILLDFGLVVLIWMVQFLIYPSFVHFNKEVLPLWHKKYSRGMFMIVMPLMIGQLIVSVLQLLAGVTFFSVVYALVVFLLWLMTFHWFVPLHSKIAANLYTAATLKNLESRNWLRTVLWTLLFAYSLYNYYR